MPPRRITLRARIGLRLIALIVTLAVASAALAYFTTVGSGQGPVTVGQAQTITLSPGTPTAQLYPGGTGDVAVAVDNPNPTSIRIGSLSLSTGQGTAGFSVDSGHSGCATSALSFTTQTNGGSGWIVPPKVGSTDGSLSIDLTSALGLSTGAANVCQGASFTVYLTAGP